jgi:hypothetical protein
MAVACVLSWSCSDSSPAPSTGDSAGTAGTGTGGTGGHGGMAPSGGTNQSAGASPGGNANQGGSADQGGTSVGGSGGQGDAGRGGAGQSGATTNAAGEGGVANEGGGAGQSEAPPVFQPWALWPMPNPVSAGLPNPASYDTTTAGVVTDKVTGLIWQRTVTASTFAWVDAKAYCANLVLAGFSDWRLPSRVELVSLLDFTIAKPGPTIDSAAFPGAPSATFWTSSPRALYTTTNAWYIQFDNAFAFYDDMTVEHSARCVR